MKFEVCVDNIKSVEIANQAKVDRLELCAALFLGGVTPSYAFIEESIKLSKIEHHVMIRPRAGDFIFDEKNINIMINDIKVAKSLGVSGVVIGALKPNREIDVKTCEKLIHAADGLAVTFHRAFDLCYNLEDALEQVIELGCERLLTSGVGKSAWFGRVKIAQLVEQSQGRISIMPGAGITSANAYEIIETTKAKDIHFSAKSIRKNKMQSFDLSIGSRSEADNQVIQTCLSEILDIKNQLKSFA